MVHRWNVRGSTFLGNCPKSSKMQFDKIWTIYLVVIQHDHVAIFDNSKLLFCQAHEFQSKNDFDLVWFAIRPALELMGS